MTATVPLKGLVRTIVVRERDTGSKGREAMEAGGPIPFAVYVKFAYNAGSAGLSLEAYGEWDCEFGMVNLRPARGGDVVPLSDWEIVEAGRQAQREFERRCK